MGTRNENIITVIDLGSAKTVALVVETTETGLRYRGHGVASSGGTRRGVIVDLDQAGAAWPRPCVGRKRRAGSRWSRRWSASAGRTSVREQPGSDCAGSEGARDYGRGHAGRRRPGARDCHAGRPRHSAPADAGVRGGRAGWRAAASGHAWPSAGSAGARDYLRRIGGCRTW